MIDCKTGDNRLRGGLPKGWKVGDKAGTGDYGGGLALARGKLSAGAVKAIAPRARKARICPTAWTTFPQRSDPITIPTQKPAPTAPI